MLYGEYLKGLKGSIFKVRRAVKQGAILSRFERFDSMFKSELALREGIVKNSSSVKRQVLLLKDIDYRIASFYARYLSKVVKMSEKGYSFKDVESLFKSIVARAKVDYIFKGMIGVDLEDKNNVFTVTLVHAKSEEVLTISNKEELVENTIALLSFLGCSDETNNASKDWLGMYLAREYRKIKRGSLAKPYLDKNNIFINLKDCCDVGSDATDRSENVIEFPKSGGSVAL